MQTEEKSIQTEVCEKHEESLSQCKVVEDINDDEIMELRSELNACEATTIFNSSRFVSHASRLGLREGIAVGLTAARANGTMWDISF